MTTDEWLIATHPMTMTIDDRMIAPHAMTTAEAAAVAAEPSPVAAEAAAAMAAMSVLGVSRRRDTDQNSQTQTQAQQRLSHDSLSVQEQRLVFVPNDHRYLFTGVNAITGKTGQQFRPKNQGSPKTLNP